MATCLLFEQTDHKGDDGHDGKNDEQDFGDLDGTGRNATKTKDGRDQRDDEKNDGIMQHDKLLEWVELKNVSFETLLKHLKTRLMAASAFRHRSSSNAAVSAVAVAL
jgi:hypothetical protein